MIGIVILLLGILAPAALAQSVTVSACAPIPNWGICDLSFELNPDDSPQATLRAEFRSPRHRTLLIPAFREGQRFVIRFAPTEVGAWEYRLTSSVKRLDGEMGQVTSTDSGSQGFVRVANVHHFATEQLGTNGAPLPHLWMSTAVDGFDRMPRADFDTLVNQRAQEHFTHLRVTIEAATNLTEAAQRVRAINAKGLAADLVLVSIPQDPRERERYLADIVARFSPLNITWALLSGFEKTGRARDVLKETGALIQKLDPYAHPRTTVADGTSGGLAGDGWMNVLSYGTTEINTGAVEHQLFSLPAVNSGIRNQQDLWNATMNGQYPGSGSGPYMKAWAEFMAQSRYWELEPYFDVDGGRALALDGVEYIVYVEKPGPLELTLENHSYDVTWMNPATGEMIKQKEYKGEHFTGEAPDKSHDWVLRVSREGRKEGMLKSYKFDSRPVPVQEVEQNPLKVPFEIASPSAGEISLAKPGQFSLKAKRESRATRSLLVEWTAEVVLEGTGYRVVGTGKEGTLRFPPGFATKFPGVLSLRVALLNANGKAYTLDRSYRLVP